MYKLNNRGWGLGVMIGFLCGLIVFLVIGMLLAYSFGINKESPESLYDEITEEAE